MQTGNRGGGRADVRTFAVVDKHHAVFLADFFDAMRQALEGFDVFEQCFARQTDGLAQSHGSHNVGGVVQALQRDVLRGNQIFIALFQAACLAFQPKIGFVFQRKPFHLAPGAFHCAAERIIRIQNLHAIATENLVLGMRIVEQVVVAVEMVFRNVQHRRRSRAQAFSVFQLEAGKLQHPHVRLFTFALQFRLQNRRTDIARDNGIQPALDAEVADQARYRGFAVAAGNRNHLVAAAVHNIRQQFDVAQHTSTVLLEHLNIRLPLADAGAERQNIKAVVQRIFQTARIKHQPVKHLTDLRHALGLQLRIISGHLRTVFAQISNH